jgi:thymidylate synthase
VARAYSFGTAAEALKPLAQAVIKEGRETAPRGQKTYELTDVTIEVLDPTNATLYGCGRPRYHPAIGALEGLLMLAGVSDPPYLAKLSNAFPRFQDGGALHGAYGPRLRSQLPWALARLQQDPATRQAVCTIWDPLHDLAPDPVPRDVPCTVDLLFRIRDGKLGLKVHMRSNDLWRGWCYDVLQFTLLQCTVANVLRLPVGPYVHHASSLHLYQADVDDAFYVTDPVPGVERPRLCGLSPGLGGDLPLLDRWESVRQRALALLYNQPAHPLLTDTERWLVARVRGEAAAS